MSDDVHDRRSSTVDTRALEVATTALVKIEGHERICTERYQEIRDTFSGIRGDVRSSIVELRTDIKTAVKEETGRWFRIGILVIALLVGAIGTLVGIIVSFLK